MYRAALLLGLTGSCLAADTNPNQVLARLRERVLDDLRRMPNYTCVETVTREYFKPNVGRPPASCDALAASKARGSYKLAPWSLDRLKLDVAVGPAREVYSWAGAREFDDRDLTDIIGGGPIGTGAFGAFLTSIFGGKDALFTYIGETTVGGRSLMEFGYRIPRENSHYHVKAEDGWVITSYDGNLLADPETSDLVRLSIRTDELPPETGSCETRTQLDYHRVTIGPAGFLLPSTTRQRFVLRNGIESENTSTFSACREYRGQSTVRFLEEGIGETGNPLASRGGQTKGLAQLPADLPVLMELAAPLDTWTAAGGDMIVLRLAKPIVDSVKRVLLPAGSAIEARLIRVQRYFTKPERVTVVMRPETMDRSGTGMPFPLLPAFHQVAQPVYTGFRWRGEAMGELPMPNEIKFGVFHFVGDHVILPKGYRTNWFTAPEPE